MTSAETSYSAADITVLEGLEAVRKRPGMYIGSTGPTGLHHLVWEVVDNSVDEAMAGHCRSISVRLLEDGGCEVSDDGRGIPVDRHPQYEDLTAAEVVLTLLHAGGKFGGEGYKISGGLHGVGVSVVNALSSRVEVEIDREGRRHYMEFSGGGHLVTRLKEVGPSPDGRTGTTVRFWPDPAIFDETTFRLQTLVERFQMMAFLNRGLEITVHDERGDEQTEQSFCYEGGIRDFVAHVNATKESLFAVVGYYEQAEEEQEVEVAFQWNTGFNTDGLHSFANGINTIEGGMHEEGFRSALTGVVNRYVASKGLFRNGDDKLQNEDIREGLTAIISVRLAEPQFEGQTKSKLGNVSIRSLVQRATNDHLGPPSGHESPPRRPGGRPDASRRSTAPACPTSSRTAPRASPASASCSSSRVTRPAARPSRPVIPAPWRSSRSAARSSTSSGRAPKRCSTTTRYRR